MGFLIIVMVSDSSKFRLTPESNCKRINRSGGAHALSRLVTLRTAAFAEVKEYERIAHELFAHDSHDIP